MKPITNLQKTIIEEIQSKKECSRKYLASVLNVTPAAITQATKGLLDFGILKISYEDDSSHVGRKEVFLTLEPNSFFSIGVDVYSEYSELIVLNAICEKVHYLVSGDFDDLVDEIRSLSLDKCVGLTLSVKGYKNDGVLREDIQDFIMNISDFGIKVNVLNNICALAYSFKMFNPNEKDFIIIKYGPGVGSVCMKNGELLNISNNPVIEVGKTLTGLHGMTIEEVIHYDSISKSNAQNLIVSDKNVQEEVLTVLATLVINVDTLLQLNKIIISGDIFQYDEVFASLKGLIASANPKIAEKIVRMDNYPELRRKKSALSAQYIYLNDK